MGSYDAGTEAVFVWMGNMGARYTDLILFYCSGMITSIKRALSSPKYTLTDSN